MLIPIEQPKIKFKFIIQADDKFYYDNINNIYCIKNARREEEFFFDKKGNYHNKNNYAYRRNDIIIFRLNNKNFYQTNDFAKEILGCKDFCKQRCF